MVERDGKRDVPAAEAEGDPLAPPTEAELAAARLLRDAREDPSIPSEEAELARALSAAWSPAELGPGEIEALVAGAVDDAARGSADALARALEGEAPSTTEGELALALRAAWSPAELPAAEHAAIVAKALGEDAKAKPSRVMRQAPERGVVVRVAFGVSVSALALAASIALFVSTRETETPAAPLAHARSTQPLFSEPFRSGEASARIDRIALARASDLRDNRFARWGVKK